MKVKNYQEELVLNTVELVLQDRNDIEADDLFVHDVAAYTLNRIPPKYIMSERGFTRLASEYWLDNGSDRGFTNLVELVVLVNRAIELVSSRRRPAVAESSGSGLLGEGGDTPTIEYWHNFPHFIGKVVVNGDHEPAYGVCVTLYVDGSKSEPAEAGWQNPYYTNEATHGFFSFWPRPAHSEVDAKRYSVAVSFDHPDYAPQTIERLLETNADYEASNYIKVDDIFNLGTVSLVGK